MDGEPHSTQYKDLQLPEPLPEYPHVTIEDIQAISKERIGLRTTSPEKLASEVAEGVDGDFLQLHNVGHFLDTDDEELLRAPGDLQSDLLQAIFSGSDLTEASKKLKGLDTLPQRYEQALKQVFEKAIRWLGRQSIDSSYTLKEYIESLKSSVPSMMIVHDIDSRTGRDHEYNFGFTKRGRNFISPQAIRDSASGIGEEEIGLLEERYKPFLALSVLEKGRFAGREKYLADFVSADVTTILVGKTTVMLKGQTDPQGRKSS